MGQAFFVFASRLMLTPSQLALVELLAVLQVLLTLRQPVPAELLAR